MAANVQIAYRDFAPPQPAAERIQERIDRLDRLHPRITSCRVVGETPQRHRHKGRLYRVCTYGERRQGRTVRPVGKHHLQ